VTPSQTDQVLARLRLNGSRGLTPLEALNDLGVFRLGARVWDLRRDGHLIVNEWMESGGKRYARYVLHESVQLAAFEEVIVGYQ
jgi:hypothetical protein